MRVLLISPAAPSAEHVNGGSTRMHRLYRRLIELGDSVTVASVFTEAEARAIEQLEAEGFRVSAHVRPRSRIRELAGALLRRPSLLRGLARRSFKSLIASVFWVDLAPIVQGEIERGEYDVVVIEGSFAAGWRDQIETGLPVVLVTHEVESVQLMAKGARIGGPAGLLRYVDGARVRREEQRHTPKFDGVVVMSADEQRRLTEIVGAGTMPKSYIVGNGADLELMAQAAEDPDRFCVLFTGTLAYPPNTTGAQWLARDVWPRVLAAEPRARLEIVGASPPHAIRALDELEAVTVHSDVPEMLSWFSGASVCVLPMLEGGGTRLKLIDAFAARRAVVSTSNGATGIDCRDGRELLIADSAEDFARAVTRLLGDRELRARLGAGGRALAERSYGWDGLGQSLRGALAEIVAARTATPIDGVTSDRYA